MSDEVFSCDKCGTREHIDLLDGYPDDPNNAENCDFTKLRCIICHDRGWSCENESIAKSVAPKFKLHYQRYLARKGGSSE